jgi:integrase
MSSDQLLKHAGIHVTYSSIDVPTFRQAGDVNSRAKRFIRFQNDLITRPDYDPIVVSAHLVAFEMVDPMAFASLTPLDKHIVPTAFGSALEFGTQGTTAKRYLLSQLTMHCISQCPCLHMNLQFSLIDLLKSLKDYEQFSTSHVLTELRCDQLAWAFKHLPMTIFAHVAGIIVCTPLSSDSWQRQRTELAPSLVSDEITSEMPFAASNLLDATCTTEGANTSAALIGQAISCLSINAGEAAQECLQRWLRLLDALTPRLHEYSAKVGLVVSWIAHLVEHGTVNAEDADVLTRKRYVQVLAGVLYKHICDLPSDPCAWTKLERFETYTNLLLESENSDKRALSAAIASFQDFLLEAFDVQPVQANLSRFVPDAVPRAQQVFLHEVERVSNWLLEGQFNDEPLRLRLQAALWMSYSAPFRIAELLGLQMSSVTATVQGHYEIWITPIRDQTLKTSAGRRRVWIREPRACAYLRELMNQRIKECAVSSDLLFACGVEGRVAYQAGRMRRILINALKASTGDAAMTIHALRHSFVCRELEALLLSSSIANFNRLTHLAAQVGHASIHTTLQFYFHRMEWPLRVHINAALNEQLNWTSSSASKYLGISAAALRKRLSRPWASTRSLGELLINLDATNTSIVPDTAKWCVPNAPHIPQRKLARASPSMILNLLLLLEIGEHSEELLAHRFGIDKHKVIAIVQHVRDVSSHLSTTPTKRKPKPYSFTSKQSSPPFIMKKILQSKYVNAVKKLGDNKLDDLTIRHGVAAWKRLRNKYGYLELNAGLETFAFLSLLKHLDFLASDFCVVTCTPPTEGQIKQALHMNEAKALKDSLERHQASKAGIKESFLRAMNALPHSFFHREVRYHPTRPAVYLLWQPASDQSVASAASDLRGLDALLLSLSTFLHLAETEVV